MSQLPPWYMVVTVAEEFLVVRTPPVKIVKKYTVFHLVVPLEYLPGCQ